MTNQRSSLLKYRNNLSEKLQLLHQQQATKHFIDYWKGLTDQPLHIALYTATIGELKTEHLIQFLSQQNCQLYLPIITSVKNSQMEFHPFRSEQELVTNHLGIKEPLPTKAIAGQDLDLVISPLVGFDDKGHRIGMGGGFYDRFFAFKKQPLQQKPFLIGWAHSGQQLPKIHPQAWDVSLDAIITEKSFFTFRNDI